MTEAVSHYLRGWYGAIRVSFLSETEIPGINVSLDQLQIICHRYYFASRFVSGKQVLEVGCGPGLGLGYLSREAKQVIGGDVTTDSLRHAQRHYGGRVELVSLDAHNLPFRDRCFDAVICLAAVIYLDVPTFFNECHRVLKKGGVLVLNTPNKDMPGFHPSRLSRKYYSIPELLTLLRHHRFSGASFLGSFPVRPHGKTGLAQKVRATMTLTGVRILDACAVMPGVTGFKEFLKKFVSDRTFVLPEEIKQEDTTMVENIELAPLPTALSNSRYRIVYVVSYAI